MNEVRLSLKDPVEQHSGPWLDPLHERQELAAQADTRAQHERAVLGVVQRQDTHVGALDARRRAQRLLENGA